MSPFRSEKQRRLLWMKHPDIAKRWTKKYGSDPVESIKKKVVKRRGSN